MSPHYTNTGNPIDFPKSESKMNERIHELADRVMKDAKGGLNFEQFYEKFAELLYKDILSVVAAHALLNESAMDAFTNLKRVYEDEE